MNKITIEIKKEDLNDSNFKNIIIKSNDKLTKDEVYFLIEKLLTIETV